MRAEAEARGLDIEVDSAGTGDWHVGAPPDHRAQATARRYGIDISGYRGRQVKAVDFVHFTDTFALDDENLRDLRRLAPPNATAHVGLLMDLVPGRIGHNVQDPYYGGDEGFEVTWSDVTAAARALVLSLGK